MVHTSCLLSLLGSFSAKCALCTVHCAMGGDVWSLGLARNAHLIVSVWDYDRFNEDDLIGVCSLSFKAVLGELAQQV